MELSEINKPNILFYDVHALVTGKSISTAKTGSAFATINLRDGSTSLKGMKWSYKAEKYDELLTLGSVVKVSGKTKLYNGAISIEFDTLEVSEKSPDDFIRKTRFDVAKMYGDIMAIINTFTEPLPAYVADYLLTTYKDEFCKAPAATNMHQPWVGGLLEHTHSMLSIALPIVAHYQSKYDSTKQHFSRDKVLFGIIIHDLGKIFEYDVNSPTFQKTLLGKLENHIVKCPILIHEAAMKWYSSADTDPDFNFELEKAHLIHLVATHHGQLEYGSPMLPSTLEAILLHQIDMIDSRFMHALELIEGKEGSEGFSDYSTLQKTAYLRNKGYPK
jgi:3'-5' exoribonuclease